MRYATRKLEGSYAEWEIVPSEDGEIDLPGQFQLAHVRADSSIEGGGLQVVVVYDDGRKEWLSGHDGAALLGSHPSVLYWREATEMARSAQRECGRTLAAILRGK